MAKDLTRYQQGIVRRYYEHQDTIRSEKLTDLVGEIFLCDDAKKADKLWKRAEAALTRAGCNEAQLRTVMEKRDPQLLAKLAAQFDAKKR